MLFIADDALSDLEQPKKKKYRKDKREFDYSTCLDRFIAYKNIHRLAGLT